MSPETSEVGENWCVDWSSSVIKGETVVKVLTSAPVSVLNSISRSGAFVETFVDDGSPVMDVVPDVDDDSATFWEPTVIAVDDPDSVFVAEAKDWG